MTTSEALPTWDTDGLFPGLASREYAAGREAIQADLRRLVALYDRHDVRHGAPRTPTPADGAALAEVIEYTNELLDEVEQSSAYVAALVSTDATDEVAAREYATLELDLTDLSRLTTRLRAWVGRLGAEALVASGPLAAEHAHTLRQAEVSSRHQMDEASESLLADLHLSGGSAWYHLYNDLTARLTGSLHGVDEPITVLRGKATDPDPAEREAAQAAEIAAWETASLPIAACLNGIKGEAITVAARRGWADPLEQALHDNAVERETLGAMQAATVASFPHFRRFLRAKAKLLGRPGALPWWDLVAPVPGEPSVGWSEATATVQGAFASYSPHLEGLIRRALDERWIDAGPRGGKQGGAFCMPVRPGESRVLMNFDGSWDSVQTLAHELGHAYHNVALATRTPLQRELPMALAETASIFCETIVVAAGLQEATDAQRLALLNVDLGGAAQVVVDIHSRFLFESELFKRREKGPLSVRELCEMMTEAQLATYGDGLDPATLHPYMWAVKPHYYFTDAHFYNWPYCFGLLFGIGLFARYRQDPDRFRSGYDDLLASSGMGTAAALAGRFEIDIRSEAFWASSLEVLVGRIDEFCRLVG
jgi:oligoendopeptidase F